MKKWRSFIILALVAVSMLVLVGCTSVSSLIKANIHGLPFWYYSPDFNIGRNKTGIVGSGYAATERQAELLAYADIIEKLSTMVGYELSQESYRELSVLHTLSQFGLYINDQFTGYQNGQVAYHVHAIMDKGLLDVATSEETKRRADLVQRIEKIVQDGDEAVKAGQELRAVKNYMRAMAMGYGLDYIDAQYSFDALYPVVTEIVESMSLSISSQRSSSARCVVSLMRHGTFVSSSVSSAEIVSSYLAVDSRGQLYRDNFIYVTNNDGQLSFNPINNSMVRTGSVEFSFNLGPEFQLLAGIEEEKVSRLKALVDSKSVEFVYSRTYSLGSIAVAVIEHDPLGEVTGVTDISSYLTQALVSNSAEAQVFLPELDDEEDVLYEFQHSGRREACLLVLRVGEVDCIQSKAGVYVASAEGLVTLYNVKTSEVLYRSEILYASAFSNDEDEAMASAFRKIADLAYSMVKAVYV